MKKKWIAVLLILSMLFCMTGCSTEYDNAEKHIVNVTVLRTEKNLIGLGNFMHMTITYILILVMEMSGKLITLNYLAC